MDLHAPIAVVERAEGTPALVGYLIGLALGTAVAVPIIAAIFGVTIPVL
jgi:hypothetical protein